MYLLWEFLGHFLLRCAYIYLGLLDFYFFFIRALPTPGAFWDLKYFEFNLNVFLVHGV